MHFYLDPRFHSYMATCLYKHAYINTKQDLLFDKIEGSHKSHLFFSRKRPIFLHTCAICSELPTNYKYHGIRRGVALTAQTYPNQGGIQGCRINCTVCPRSSDPFYIVSYYIKCVTTSWTHCRAKPRVHYRLF